MEAVKTMYIVDALDIFTNMSIRVSFLKFTFPICSKWICALEKINSSYP